MIADVQLKHAQNNVLRTDAVVLASGRDSGAHWAQDAHLGSEKRNCILAYMLRFRSMCIQNRKKRKPSGPNPKVHSDGYLFHVKHYPKTNCLS